MDIAVLFYPLFQPSQPLVREITRNVSIKLNNKRVSLRCLRALSLPHRTLPYARRDAPAEPSSDHTPLGGFVLEFCESDGCRCRVFNSSCAVRMLLPA
jgi:hypothetical protein